MAVRMRWLDMVDDQSRDLGLRPEVLGALIYQESRWDSTAINHADPAYGLGQVMPKYWRDTFVNQCGVQATPTTLMRVSTNICYTAHILAHFVSVHGNIHDALNAYNNGTGRDSSYAERVLNDAIN